jgi:hypothetical protein
MTDPTVPAAPRSETHIGPGAVIDGRYRIVEQLGEGGMAIVYLADELDRDSTPERVLRQVAIKVISPDMRGPDYESYVRRFQVESLIAGQITHRNIARVYGSGCHGREPYLVLELLKDHQTIKDFLQKRKAQGAPLALEEILGIVRPVLQALKAVHSHGFIHRDVKPSNLIFARDDDGEQVVLLTDFGIAKHPDKELGATRISNDGGKPVIVGTPKYIAPEHFDPSATIDCRADIWAVGAVLFELATFDTAYPADSHRKAHQLFRSGYTPKFPKDFCARYPVGLRYIIMRALEKDPAERYVNATEMLADLARIDKLPDWDGAELVAAGEAGAGTVGSLDMSSALLELAMQVPGEHGTPPLSGKPLDLDSKIEQQVKEANDKADVRRGGLSLVRPRDKLFLGVIAGALLLCVIALATGGPSRSPSPTVDNGFTEPEPPRVTAADLVGDRRAVSPHYFRAPSPTSPVAGPTSVPNAAPDDDTVPPVQTEGQTQEEASSEPVAGSPDASEENAQQGFTSINRQLSGSQTDVEALPPEGAQGPPPRRSKRRRRAAATPDVDAQPSLAESQVAAYPATSTASPSNDDFDEWAAPDETPPSLRVSLANARDRLPRKGETLGVTPDKLVNAVLKYGLSSHRPESIVIAVLTDEIELPDHRKIPKGARLTGIAAFAVRGEDICFADVRFDTLVLQKGAAPIPIQAMATTRGQAGIPCRLRGKLDRRHEAAVTEGLIDIAQNVVAKATGVEPVAKRVLDVEREDTRTLLTPEDPPATVSAMHHFQVQFLRYQ